MQCSHLPLCKQRWSRRIVAEDMGMPLDKLIEKIEQANLQKFQRWSRRIRSMVEDMGMPLDKLIENIEAGQFAEILVEAEISPTCQNMYTNCPLIQFEFEVGRIVLGAPIEFEVGCTLIGFEFLLRPRDAIKVRHPLAARRFRLPFCYPASFSRTLFFSFPFFISIVLPGIVADEWRCRL
jgi:hypothetical protein